MIYTYVALFVHLFDMVPSLNVEVYLSLYHWFSVFRASMAVIKEIEKVAIFTRGVIWLKGGGSCCHSNMEA